MAASLAAPASAGDFAHIAANLQAVRQDVAAAAAAAAAAARGAVAGAGVAAGEADAAVAPAAALPLLVAVSKLNPAAAVAAAAAAGQQHFGENYVHELLEKAPLLPQTLRWHFIGHLQTNKVKALLQGVPSLFSVDSVDSNKLAEALQKEASKLDRTLNVLVNAGGEQQKGGVLGSSWEDTKEAALSLALFIEEECPHLVFKGFMTVAPHEREEAERAFKRMRELKKEALSSPQLGKALAARGEAVELSMGMTGDMDLAIAEGSTQPRARGTIQLGHGRSEALQTRFVKRQEEEAGGCSSPLLLPPSVSPLSPPKSSLLRTPPQKKT
ncbi:hypothetical protein Efla_007007 [Eimeria flavescens]